jgi:diguanylate cyclase (GGDEF)-like protein
MKEHLLRQLRSVWSSTRHDSPELTRFAHRKAVEEARKGLVAMSLLMMGILLIEALLYVKFALDPLYLYTCAILVMLSLNMVFAARTVVDPRALHLLGITLLAVSCSAFILLAHYQQVFHPMLFASVAMLFIVIPMMSWGLSEALSVTLLIYIMFTLSTMDADYNIADQSLWTLQFIMLGASAVSLSLVVRNVKLRKHDVETQHDLVVAHAQITDLSNRDPLTNAWNRRYFDLEFHKFLEKRHANQHQLHFMLIDIDDFKIINDICGHESGDRVLEFIVQTFDELIVDHGSLVRMGGDEFALVFSGLDPAIIARRGLMKLREITRDSQYKPLIELSLSFGTASVPYDIEVSYRQLYKQADLALYQAKMQKGSDPDSPNFAISTLHDPEDVHDSTQRLWNPMASKDKDASTN